ncbi:hypothetical protein ACH4VM_39555 [Streptomyces sp. NPDC020792]|uniref:hypothetical protein n=1 Tax=Streptomyces sp. NPDC020792 TaxID=3365089 RepID=UPI0037A8F0DE
MILRKVAMVAITAAAVALPAVPAAASESGISGWNGKCYTNWTTTTQANVWCDGTGPERYGASIVCTKGTSTRQLDYANGPWFGDRRGITMTCPSGYTRSQQWGWPAG